MWRRAAAKTAATAKPPLFNAEQKKDIKKWKAEKTWERCLYFSAVLTFLPLFAFVASELSLVSWPTLANDARRALGLSSGHPQVVLVEGYEGILDHRANGEFILMGHYRNGKPIWMRRTEEPDGQLRQTYVVWGTCGAWLVSTDPRAFGSRCTGLAKAESCAWPWDCWGRWQVRGKSSDKWSPVPSMLVTAEAEIPAAEQSCSAHEEQGLVERFQDLDVVVLWSNASDPTWRDAREEACRSWPWLDTWPDAVQKSKAFKDGGADGFAREHCGPRASAIRDHGGLRYLLRSLERNLAWHRGRILVVAPREQRPAWLRPGGRLRVIPQEDLLGSAMSSEWFVRQAAHVPSSAAAVFHDLALEAALPFLQGAPPLMLYVPDLSFFTRPVGACQLFTKSAGLRVFAGKPQGGKGQGLAGLEAGVQGHTSQVWAGLPKEDSAARPYLQAARAPSLLDTELLREIWRASPRELSETVAAAFPHPGLTDAISLHHSELARRARSAREAAAQGKGGSRGAPAQVVDVRASLGLIVRAKSLWSEVVFRALRDWKQEMSSLPPEQSELPLLLSFRDEMPSTTGMRLSKLDCSRENWLDELLPEPSAFEDPLYTSRCRAEMERHRSEL